MEIDQPFLDSLSKAVNYFGGINRFGAKLGLSPSTVHNILNKKPGRTIQDATKKKIILTIKIFFPNDYPWEKWMVDKESSYLVLESRTLELKKSA